MPAELINNFISGQMKESDDRTVLITFKLSLPDGPDNLRYKVKEEFKHDGRDYIALAYRLDGGENAGFAEIVLSKERYDELWEQARKEWKEEQEELDKQREKLDRLILGFRSNTSKLVEDIKKNQMKHSGVCG